MAECESTSGSKDVFVPPSLFVSRSLSTTSIATAADSDHIRFAVDHNDHNSTAALRLLNRQKTPYDMSQHPKALRAEPWSLPCENIDSGPSYRFSVTSPKRRSTVIRQRTMSSVSSASKRAFRSVKHWYYLRKEWILSRVAHDAIWWRGKHQKLAARDQEEDSSQPGEDAVVEDGVFCIDFPDGLALSSGAFAGTRPDPLAWYYRCG